jgi:hypothetical protein
VKKAHFDSNKPWRLKELPKAIRLKIESEYDLEPRAKYVGGVDGEAVFEVPQCPYYGVGTVKEHRCKHAVFCFDSTNGEYVDVAPAFRDYVTKTLNARLQKNGEVLTGFLEEALTDIHDGKFPRPTALADILKGFSFKETFDDSGVHGIGFGYASDRLLANL